MHVEGISQISDKRFARSRRSQRRQWQMGAQPVQVFFLIGDDESGDRTNLGLCSDAVGAIDPDVFGEDSTLLVQFHVFHELEMTVSCKQLMSTACGSSHSPCWRWWLIRPLYDGQLMEVTPLGAKALLTMMNAADNVSVGVGIGLFGTDDELNGQGRVALVVCM